MKMSKKILALVLSFVLLALPMVNVGAVDTNATQTADSSDYVSRVVTNGDESYVEYLGKPYLFYGVQMRVDWQYEDKLAIYGTRDWSWIEENFQKVVDLGFKSVAIPVNWNYIEKGTEDNHYYDFAYVDKMYEYIEKYDLTVQWLWFGTNVCGSANGTILPSYINGNITKYKKMPKIEWDITLKTTYSDGTVVENKKGVAATGIPENATVVSSEYVINGYDVIEGTDSGFMDFSADNPALLAERNALSALMEHIAIRDTEKRCVMIQVNNEVDQGGNSWIPKKFDINGNTIYYTNGNAAPLEDWWSKEEWHDKYCWAFGQRDEFFAQQSALGNIIHNSSYNCVTRVNFSAAGRSVIGQPEGGYTDEYIMNEYSADYEALLSLGGIDIIGLDSYYHVFGGKNDSIIATLTEYEGNVKHLAESDAVYDMSTNTARLFEINCGNLVYCHRSDRTGGGFYVSGTDVYNEQSTVIDATTGEERLMTASELKRAQRTYDEWTERGEYVAKVREFNNTINKAYYQLGEAIAKGTYSCFTANGESKDVANMNITFNSDIEDDKLAMAFDSKDGLILMSAKTDGQFTVNGLDSTKTAQVGYFDSNNNWVKTADATVSGNMITVAKGEAVRIVEKVTYSVLGEEFKYDSTDFTASTDVTLPNGAPAVKVNGATELVLSEDLENFRVDFKYHCTTAGEVNNAENFALSMRGGYYRLLLNYWGAKTNSDIVFESKYGTNKRQQSGLGYWEGGQGIWNNFTVIVADRRVAILKNGAIWYEGELPDASKGGELKLEFSGAYETYIGELEVTTAEKADTYILYDVPLDDSSYGSYVIYDENYYGGSDRTYNNYNKITGTYGDIETSIYDAEAGGFVPTTISGFNFGSHYETYTFLNNFGWSDSAGSYSVSAPKELIFETDFQIMDNGGNAWQRGMKYFSQRGFEYQINQDGSYKVLLGTTTLKTGAVTRFDKGVWSNIRVESRETYENLYINGVLLYTATIPEGTAYTSPKIMKHSNNADAEIFLRNLRFINAEHLPEESYVKQWKVDESLSDWSGNVTWEYEVKAGEPAVKYVSKTNNFNFGVTNPTGNKVLHLRTYISSDTGTELFGIFLNGRKVEITFQSHQCYIVNTGNSTIYKNWLGHLGMDIFNKWIDIDIYMSGNYMALLVDGTLVSYYEDADLTTGSDSWHQLSPASSGNIWFSEMYFKDVANVEAAKAAINAVTYTDGVADETQRAAAIKAYEKLIDDEINMLGKAGRDAYAKAYYKQGDVNMDEVVNVMDIIKLKKMSLELIDQNVKADFNGDAVFNAMDMAALMRKNFGL